MFRPNSFETPREQAILAMDVLRTIIILVIVFIVVFQKSRDMYRKKCKSVTQELVRLCLALLMFVFTIMDMVETYRLTMPTNELYTAGFQVRNCFDSVGHI